jgi:cytoskeleton protein RodZ
MAGSFPNIDPNIMSLLMQGSADGGGSSGITPFIAGMGFDRFAQTIKKLHGLAGGNKTDANVETGLLSTPATPTGAPRPTAPIAQAAPAPSPTGGNPLLSLSKILPLLQSGAAPANKTFAITNPAVAPAGSTTPALAVPGMAAGPAAGPAAAATGGAPPNPSPVPFADYFRNQAAGGGPLPAGIASYLRNQYLAFVPAAAASSAPATVGSGLLALLGLAP